jgi:hypothetical protein
LERHEEGVSGLKVVRPLFAHADRHVARTLRRRQAHVHRVRRAEEYLAVRTIRPRTIRPQKKKKMLFDPTNLT